MGSRLKTDLAYIAGFLDGDGSMMLQLKRRSDTGRGVRFMATLCFYQDARHAAPLSWMRDILSIGYLSSRKDGMAELRINGFASVRQVLILLRPYLRFKMVQADALLRACATLESKKMRGLDEKELRELVELIFVIKEQNYKSSQTLAKAALLDRLGLTP